MIIRELEDMQEVPESFDYFNDFKDTDQYSAMRIAKLERLKAQLNARNAQYWQREQGRAAREIADLDAFGADEVTITTYKPGPPAAFRELRKLIKSKGGVDDT